jgi:glycosyltransferase involved in cell wall biosynthesis
MDFLGEKMTESQPLVSVIIPSYNYLKYISQCIESVQSQDYPNIELIIVDDGSTDGSFEFLQMLNSKIKIVHQSNQGVSIARNRGLLEATGEYIAFLDADDYWEPSKISKQLAVLKQVSADLVYSGISLVSSDGFEITGTFKPHFSGECASAFRRHPGRAVITLGTSNALFRKCLISKSGLFDPNLSISADWDFFRRYCDFGKVAILEDDLTYYRQHTENMSTYSNAFISDLLRSIRKMLADDGLSLRSLERYNILARTYWLLLKYRIRRYLQSR